MELVINIGNTNMRFGIFNKGIFIKSWITDSRPFKNLDEYSVQFKSMFHYYGIKKHDFRKIIIGSVVPFITCDICKCVKNLLNLKVVLVDRKTPSYVNHQSNQIGTDLYANAVSAHYNYEKSNKVVIDFGTALTIIAIDFTGTVKGVVIAPGVKTSLNALVINTAQLQEIELKKPKTVLGMNTEHCMQSGTIYGFLSMVEGLLYRVKKELNDPKAIVIATGGLVNVFSDNLNSINFFDQLHTLKGLKILGDSL